jgi:regulator of sirC expression with transglutaminase-like and TPR domain
MDTLTADVEQVVVPPDPQINAILSLLDDPDPVVQGSIRTRLLELGDVAAPALRRVCAQGEEELARRNAEQNLREIGLRKFQAEMRAIIDEFPDDEDVDLERGAFAIALLRYPELRAAAYMQQLDTMASMLDHRLRGCDNGYMIVREMNHYLYGQLGFQGCRQDRDSYYDPENSFMNRVIDRRIGIPISLSVIYLLIGQRLKLPLHGVGFPARFLVKYRSSTEEFYIDPFNNGSIINYSECRRFLREINIDYRPEYLEPISNRRTVARMMRNLLDIYQQTEPLVAVTLERMIRELTGEEE